MSVEKETSGAGQQAALEVVAPGDFVTQRHFYTRVLNATIHPLVAAFMRLSPAQLVARYCHLNPKVEESVLREYLEYQPRYLRWAGADLFCVTTAEGIKRMLLIETNSSPSGQKSMPLLSEGHEQGGYELLVQHCFAHFLEQSRFRTGGLAVLYDKNHMEASGYAAALADYFNEPVYLVPLYNEADTSHIRFVDRVLEIRNHEGSWVPIRAAMRYVTQRPWNRLPVLSRTLFFNPILGCLAGGRNKSVAAKAYDMFNGELSGTGLQIRVPETIKDVTLQEIPMLVRQLGGQAVVKVPYSNAGQGVFTITSEEELDSFMEMGHSYDKFIVQSLVGNYHWSSNSRQGRFYHVGTVPNKKGEIYVADIRMMVAAGASGFRPIAVYGRQAHEPLSDTLAPGQDSWLMLGTNLSKKLETNKWDTETDRLLLMDRKDFNKLGVGLDDLLRAFVQSVLAAIAIDKMAITLVNSKGQFRKKLFASLNPDPVLLDEIYKGE